MDEYHKNKLRAIIDGNNKIRKEISQALPAIKEWAESFDGKKMFTTQGCMRADAFKSMPSLPDGDVRLWVQKNYNFLSLKGRINISIPSGGGTICHMQEMALGRIETDGSFYMRNNVTTPRHDDDASKIIAGIEQAEEILDEASLDAQGALTEAGANEYCSIIKDLRLHV